jgi:hypothetical protein
MEPRADLQRLKIRVAYILGMDVCPCHEMGRVSESVMYYVHYYIFLQNCIWGLYVHPETGTFGGSLNQTNFIAAFNS